MAAGFGQRSERAVTRCNVLLLVYLAKCVSRMIRSQRALSIRFLCAYRGGENWRATLFPLLSLSLSLCVFFSLNAISHSLLGSATRGSHRNEFFLGVLPAPVNNNIST